MKHAKSHTYRKHGLGFAIREKWGGGVRYYISMLKYSIPQTNLIARHARKICIIILLTFNARLCCMAHTIVIFLVRCEVSHHDSVYLGPFNKPQ